MYSAYEWFPLFMLFSYTQTHTYTHTHSQINTHLYIHKYVLAVNQFLYIYIYIYILLTRYFPFCMLFSLMHTHTHIYVYINKCIHRHACMHIYTYIYIYISSKLNYIYIYIYIERERECLRNVPFLYAIFAQTFLWIHSVVSSSSIIWLYFFPNGFLFKQFLQSLSYKGDIISHCPFEINNLHFRLSILFLFSDLHLLSCINTSSLSAGALEYADDTFPGR